MSDMGWVGLGVWGPEVWDEGGAELSLKSPRVLEMG